MAELALQHDYQAAELREQQTEPRLGHLDDALQEAQGFVYGCVSVKAGSGKLVVQDSIQALRQALSLLL